MTLLYRYTVYRERETIERLRALSARNYGRPDCLSAVGCALLLYILYYIVGETGSACLAYYILIIIINFARLNVFAGDKQPRCEKTTGGEVCVLQVQVTQECVGAGCCGCSTGEVYILVLRVKYDRS